MIGKLPPFAHPKRHTIMLSGDRSFRVAYPFRSSFGKELLIHNKEILDSATYAVFEELVQSSKTFFDIGANIGIFSMIAKTIAPTVKVFAFEPIPHIFDILVGSFALNAWNEVHPEKLALGAFDGPATIHVPVGDTEASLNPEFRTETKPIECMVAKLDTYCNANAISTVELLKIDTESTEPDVLEGGRTVIGDCKPTIICEVLYGRTEIALQNFFSSLGYHFYHLTETGLVAKEQIKGDATYRDLNYVFSTSGNL